ncbi:hypothetical protein [Streptomyces sp. WMMC905]|uniref:hypothetical protein n=1 Tax=Streptomyces sp. WMMC905 TaxID=3404123 RepID=UPI003B924111
MAIWTLWRLDQRRRMRVWCARFPGLLTTPARVMRVAVTAVTATLLVALLCGAGLWQLVGAERAVTGVRILWAGLLIVNVVAGFSIQAVRGSMLVPDAVLLRQLPLTAAEIATARLLAPAALLAAGTSLVLGGAGTAGAVLTGALPTTTAVGVLLWGTCGVVASAVVARSCAMVLFWLALLAPPAWSGPLIPFLSAGRSLLSAAACILVFSRWSQPHTVLSAVGSTAGTSTPPLAATAGGLLAGATVAVVLALVALSRLDPHTAQLRMTTPGTWRVHRPLPGNPEAAIRAKDVRVLVRRGPQAWELLAGATVVVPVTTACVVIFKVLGPSAGTGPFTQAVVTAITASMLGTVLGILGEVLAPVISMDSEGQARDLLRTVPGALERLGAVRAGAYTLVVTAVGAVLLIVVQLLLRMPASAVIGLAPAVLACAAVEATVLVVASGNHPAPLRPEVMLPEPEPQVRAATMLTTGVMVSVAGPIAGAIGFIAPNSTILAILCCLLVMAVAYPAGAALPRVWALGNAREAPQDSERRAFAGCATGPAADTPDHATTKAHAHL